jgi:hypothetical protein
VLLDLLVEQVQLDLLVLVQPVQLVLVQLVRLDLLV